MDLRVCIAEEPEAAHVAALREAAGPGVEFHFGEPRPDCVTLVEGVPSGERVDACPELKVVVIPWAGVPRKTLELVRARPHLRLHNLHHNAGPAAEMAFSLFLAAAKRTVPRDRELRGGDWSNRDRMELAVGIEGKHAVVWGAGTIGRRIAAMARGFGMRVTEVARRARDGRRGAEDLDALLPSADVLFICVPLTEATKRRIGERELAALPRNAILVNVARGPVVDEAALYDALASGHLFGAGLDVWWRYPEGEATHADPSAFPFRDLDNVVMSPHRGGHVRETEPLRMAALGAALRAQAEGRPLPNPVDLERGY